MKSRIWLGVLVAGFCAVTIVAQAQTDVAASVYGAFSGTKSGNGTTQTPSNQAGFLVELHHQSHPLWVMR